MFDDSSSNVQFPWKLHVLLTAAERNGYGHIISWMPAGNAFKVHDKAAFAEVLMPKYFHSNKYKSFQRNLNLWCFQTLTKEPNKGAIFHPHFLRGFPDRCHLMRRVKVKKNSQRMSLAEVRASAPQLNLPSTSPLLASSSAAADFRVGDSLAASSAQMSELNAAQLMLLVQQESVQKQQEELQRQQLVQKLVLLSRSTGPTITPSLPNSLLNMMSAPSATQTNKLAPSPSNLNALLLNQLMVQKQQQQQQQQVQAPPASFLIPVPSAAGNTNATTSSELDRTKMQINLALLVNNNNGGPTGNNQAAGIAGLLPTNPAASSK